VQLKLFQSEMQRWAGCAIEEAGWYIENNRDNGAYG